MDIDLLRQHAADLGLQGVGIAPAIEEVREIYPWAESVVVAAISYLPPDQKPKRDKPRGLVARCARSADYHTVLGNKLRRLAHFVGKEAGAVNVKVCVDTCPIPERKLAVLAGVGRRGKNGNVFVEGCGSYVGLGEIVTDAKLDPTPPMEVDGCGDCDACIRACPTAALTAASELDRSRCISALTQMNDAIPLDLRPAMGNRIYGCDICQEVCPENAGVKPLSPEFAEDIYPGADPELIPLVNLIAEDFKRTVKDSSIGWIGRNRVRRNAAVAAGNLRCESAVPELIDLLGSHNPMLRMHAAWALGRIGSRTAVLSLRESLREEAEASVIKEIYAALSNQP